METVTDLMTPDPVTVAATAPIGECARRMLRHGVRHLPVRDAEGRLHGMITDADVFRRGGLSWSDRDRWVPFGRDEADLTAADLARAVEVALPPEALATRALRALGRSRQDFAVVVGARGEPIGILTEHDAVRVSPALIPPSVTVRVEASQPVLTVRATSPARLAWDLMQANAIRHLVVVDDAGVARGVVSYGDLFTLDATRRPGMTAGDAIGRRALQTVREGAALVDAARQMAAHRIGCLPVLDEEGRPSRILTRTDVLSALVRTIEDEEMFSDTVEVPS